MKLQDYLLSISATVEENLIEYQKQTRRKLTAKDQKQFIEKLIKAIRTENARGNLNDPGFDVVPVIQKTIEVVMNSPFRKGESYVFIKRAVN